MNETLISNWNSSVTDSDNVYIVGDLMYRYEQDPSTILSRLNGKKYIIRGNHDGSWIDKMVSGELAKYIVSVETLKYIRENDCKICLSHYPMMSYVGKYHIHGHIHNDTDGEYFDLLKTMDCVLNAGVDINNYMPVTLEELIENNKIFKATATPGMHPHKHRKMFTLLGEPST
jgi:calcineurin-like phosphoesterase family protein